MQNKIENIIFDLDGTLIDSSKDIIDCLDVTLNSFKDHFSGEVVLNESFIGPPLEEMLKNLIPDIDVNILSNIIKQFRQNYAESDLRNTLFYDGIRDLLQELEVLEIKIFIATNKPLKLTNKILSNLNINCFLDIICYDSDPERRLSKADMLESLINRWKLEKSSTIMVGDAASDINAAKINGIKSIAVLYGYGDSDSLRLSGSDFIVSEVSEIRKKLSL